MYVTITNTSHYTACIYLQDFVTANTQWTKDLCQKDSDMDGKTNGEELGDPNCVWKQGDAPAGDATGHPGKTGQRNNEGVGC